MNPCPCGYYADPTKECVCSPSQVSRYKGRISGPLLDRIDVFVEVPRIEYDKLVAPPNTETSQQVRRTHQGGAGRPAPTLRGHESNYQLRDGAGRGVGVLPARRRGSVAHALGDEAHCTSRREGSTASRSSPRTIADLSGSDEIDIAHLAEALQYRPTGWT